MADLTTAPGRFIAIHGHFYQPPRENPWLETVESQSSAAPYHDWNDRVTAECYAPNGASRIVDINGQIIRIINNYSRISFNFGPTLLSWLAENARRTHQMIHNGDERSTIRYGGHGSALAQIYNHIIMPLANTRDRITQIRWGIADFECRFGRRPEGMWLPETAVDQESLELLAEHGIRFTILAPHQCLRVREPAETSLQPSLPELNGEGRLWTETPNASVNPRRAYRVHLSHDKEIVVFFYDGPISRAIAFEGLLNSGEKFAARLFDGFDPSSQATQLVHVATDGESYGHHHRFGEMALSYALKLIEDDPTTRLTNYASFLESNPAEWEAEIVDNTSWSCAHGIERWRSDCGCNGGHPGWRQQWRTPLRSALDWLRDTIEPLTEEAGKDLFRDVWEARDAYIHVLLNRMRPGFHAVDDFLAGQALRPLSSEERIRALKLMEMQRHAQLMYTSCGWFFDDISGIETVQVIAYAARAIQLAAEITSSPRARFEEPFLKILAEARSNLPELGNGAEIYRKMVKPLEVSIEQIAAHYAIASCFSSHPEVTRLFCYSVRRLEQEKAASGLGRLVMGRVTVTSRITEEHDTYFFSALHFGDQNVTASVKRYSAEDVPAFVVFRKNCALAMTEGNLPEVVRLMDGYFGASPYSLASLFGDDLSRILQQILKSTLGQVEHSMAAIYEEHASLLHYLSTMRLPKPAALTMAAGFAINAALRRALSAEPIDPVRIRSLVTLMKTEEVPLDQHEIGFLIDQRMKGAMVRLQAEPLDTDLVASAARVAAAATELPFRASLWQAQNIWNEMLIESSEFLKPLDDQAAALWHEQFFELGRKMHLAVEQLVVEDIPPTEELAAEQEAELDEP